MHRFDTLDYLKAGNNRQRTAYTVLSENIFPQLEKYSPVLAGTIPLAIDIEGSDLDVLCHITDVNEFAYELERNFALSEKFTIRRTEINSIPTVIANFFCGGFAIEVFGQDVPVHQQNAYRHMIVEDTILQREGDEFRKQIIDLKRKGIKTEPAFAQLLELKGDQYDALLEYGKEQNII